jgi:hypothetical protein
VLFRGQLYHISLYTTCSCPVLVQSKHPHLIHSHDNPSIPQTNSHPPNPSSAYLKLGKPLLVKGDSKNHQTP